MTPEQFDAIAKLIRSGASATQYAARLALIEGLTPTDAARQSGCSPQSASNTIRRFRDAAELIESAWPSR